jgi:hypothetical protein
MEGKGGRILFGDKELGKIKSWKISGNTVKQLLKTVHVKGRNLEFSGTFDPDDSFPEFEVGKVYPFKDHIGGYAWDAECVAETEEGYEFKITGEMRKIAEA